MYLRMTSGALVKIVIASFVLTLFWLRLMIQLLVNLENY